MKKLMQTDGGTVALVLRLALGLVMFAHGAQKVLGWFGGGGFSATLEGLSGMMPAVIAFLVIIGEFLGGLGLIVGFLTRFCAASIGVIMLGAIFMVHAQHGFFMNWYGQQQGEGFEYHLLAIGIALALTIAGGGTASVDKALASRR